MAKIRFLSIDYSDAVFVNSIECQRVQYRMSRYKFGGEAAFKKLQIKDQIKRNYCRKNGIPLYEI
jgi:hypothetical protein